MRREIKPTFSWDQEPADERPSEFKHSTGYSVLSGYHLPSDLNARAARRRSGSGWGFKSIVIAFILMRSASGVAMHELMKMLRG